MTFMVIVLVPNENRNANKNYQTRSGRRVIPTKPLKVHLSSLAMYDIFEYCNDFYYNYVLL